MSILNSIPTFPNCQKLDHTGSYISGIRIDPKITYLQIPALLKQYLTMHDHTAWKSILEQIDYLYDSFCVAMKLFTTRSDFIDLLQQELSKGKKLVFKPNIVNPLTIDPHTCGPVEQNSICTEWVIVAAVMRYFHDNCKIHYSSMALAEGSTMAATIAASYSENFHEAISSEAILEGHFHEHYGGWGFYFVRKYLSLHREDHPADDPMCGFKESCNGTYLTPYEAFHKLMVYDINKIQDLPSKGRWVPVRDRGNRASILLHKVIVGGDPDDPEDLKQYPGCVLIDLPKLKMHGQDLITNATKNIGIGLYPSQSAASTDPAETNWLYASPDLPIPNLKAKLPHSPFVMEMNETTHLPIQDSHGNYIIHKTDGFEGTELDIIRAVMDAGVLMLHICDMIHPLNLNHDHGNLAQVSSEGYLWISKDCIALDHFCARYCFKTITSAEAASKRKSGPDRHFLQKIPAVVVHEHRMLTGHTYDSPLLRYTLYQEGEKRGIGHCNYYVNGYDLNTRTFLGSVNGHLVSLEHNYLRERITKTLFYNTNTILHDMQGTFFSYAKANDILCHDDLYQKLLCTFDQNHDSVIDYTEKGRGFENAQFGLLSYTTYLYYTDKKQLLKSLFTQSAMYLRYADAKNNPKGHDFLLEKNLLTELYIAYYYSTYPQELPDPNLPGNYYGKGSWPCYSTTKWLRIITSLYESLSCDSITLTSMYGLAFQYCDKICRNGQYTGSPDQQTSHENSLRCYLTDLSNGASPLPFTLYVPDKCDKLADDLPIPNVTVTSDPARIYTAEFSLPQNKKENYYVSF